MGIVGRTPQRISVAPPSNGIPARLFRDIDDDGLRTARRGAAAALGVRRLVDGSREG